MKTSHPIVITALMVAIVLYLFGIERMAWGVAACGLVALDSLVSLRWPNISRTILIDALALVLAVEFLPLPLEFVGIPFMYFGMLVLLMTSGWRAFALSIALGLMYWAAAFMDPFGEVVRSDSQLIALGFGAGLIFVLLMLGLLSSVVSLLRAQNGRIEAARAHLEALVRSKNEFVASVSHELRTPLTGVVGFASELSEQWDRIDPEEQRAMVQLVAGQGTEVAHIVDDLLVAARADTDSLIILTTEVDILEEASRVASDIGSVDVRCDHDSLHVFADPVRLRQILRNLITNAQRYGGENIWMELDRHASTATLRVCDDGAGVPAADADRIFQAYERSESTVQQPASVGLGLSVARTLAELMGGQLHYHRRHDAVAFELTLDMARVATAEGVG